LEEGDIILSSSASLGKVSRVGPDAIGSVAYTGLIRFKPFKYVFDDYLIRFLGSSEFVRQIDESKRGAAIQHFGPTHLRGMIVPVPPQSEQHRIVAKVDALMALCDQLKSRLNDAQTTQLHLADALVEQAIG
jgi:type I restriction enzyme S subunit